MSAAAAYRDMLSELYRARRAGIELGLERVQAALAALEHPERDIGVCVHIGGTNGKGSTAAFVEAIARQCGRRTGLFTSPHLDRFAERFRIDGMPADEHRVYASYRRVQRVVSAIRPAISLTFFEWVTVMGLCLFADAEVEIAVLEVGLGGRLDATNAVSCAVACVTGVALDHQAYLGDTLAAIAGEKAGIFKPGQRAVIGCAGEPQAVPLLVQHARGAGVAGLTVVEEPVPADLTLGLAGRHQRTNAASALAIAEHLAGLHAIEPERASWHLGLARTRFPGRLEVLAERPTLLADGAHNPHGARALADALSDWPRPRILMLGVSNDKDAVGIAAALLPAVDALILTRAEHARALSIDALARAVAEAGGERLPTEFVDEPAAALRGARERAGEGGTVVVAGSLFLIADIRRCVRPQSDVDSLEHACR